VIAATQATKGTVRISPVRNSTTVAEIAAMATRACIDHRVSRGGVLMSARALPDLEALADLERVVVVRTRGVAA
jgi:hypothetical protein